MPKIIASIIVAHLLAVDINKTIIKKHPQKIGPIIEIYSI